MGLTRVCRSCAAEVRPYDLAQEPLCDVCARLFEVEVERLRTRNESLEAAHRDAAEGSAWLQKHLPTKYLGRNIVNAAAAWIQDLQASAESELRFVKSALSRHDHNSLRHDWPREVDSHRRLWVKVPAHFLEELLGISIDD